MQQFNNKILDRLPMVSLTYEKLKNVPYLSDLKQKIQEMFTAVFDYAAIAKNAQERYNADAYYERLMKVYT